MFTLPLYDDNPTHKRPIVTYLLIGACVVVFFYQSSLPPQAAQALVYGLGVVPSVLFGEAKLPPSLALVPSWLTPITSMFLHGGLLHLAGNMLYLWIFGNNVEDAMGRGRFLVFYLLCGIAAALAQSFTAPGSNIPMIGASGAIGGVLGGYILLHPRANVRVLIWILIFVRIINVPAWIVLGLWFGLQFINGAMTPTDQGGVAFWAHVGGFVAGMVLVPVFKHRSVPLFKGPRSQPFRTATPGSVARGSVPTARSSRRGLPWDER